MSWTPDETIQHPGGTTEEIRWSRRPRHDQLRARRRRVYDENGNLESIWHEVLDAQGGVVSQKRIYP